MFKSLVIAALAATLAVSAAAQTPAAKPKAKAPSAEAQAAAALARMKLDIPYTRYVLANGLTLIVHQDRKAPVVNFNIWYHVGSKNEPAGQSGFAHLFEHLMYQGSEHFNDDFFKATRQLGATEQNGSTSNDRTNYYQTVPKEALDSILWLESDRMGHFLGALTQARLDEQRGVVQNEKRRGDNQPYAISQYLVTAAIYPKGHPYDHTVIGSMEDLDAASLDKVKDWFRKYYGPSNAVIALSGDISPEEARAKVERYFGALPAGQPVAQPKVWVAKRAGAQREIAYDRVAAPRLTKIWNIPEYGNRDTAYLDMFADILGADATSRLTKRLVYDEQLATSAFVSAGGSEISGRFTVQVTGKPGADMVRIEAIVDEEIAKLAKAGPTASEVDKVKARDVAQIVRLLESASSKGALLVQSQTYLGSPDGWNRILDIQRAASPAQIAAVGRAWLAEGAYSLAILPFPFVAQGTDADRTSMPLPASVASAPFPKIQHATLANGAKVLLVERHEAPLISVQALVNTAYAADYAQVKAGTGGLAVSLMDEGTKTRDLVTLSDQMTRLGAEISVSGGGEQSAVSLSALKATLDPSLDLFADILLNPAFRQADVDRAKSRQINAIRAAKLQPASMASRVMAVTIYGKDHPYGRYATEESVGAINRDDLAAFHDRWFKPDNTTLIVVGDTTLTEIMPRLERVLGGWKATSPTPRITLAMPATPAKPVVYVVDRPGSPQSYILGGLPAAPRKGAEDFDIGAFNTNFGGNFTSRINMNLREEKGWSYGVSSAVSGEGVGPRVFRIVAEVQTDKTSESIIELKKELTDVLSTRPLTQAEMAVSQNNTIMGLASRWESSGEVTSALAEIVSYNLPDTYWETYPARIKGVTPAQALAAGLKLTPAQNFAWVVVGDRAKIEAGLRDLGMEVRIVDADANPVR